MKAKYVQVQQIKIIFQENHSIIEILIPAGSFVTRPSLNCNCKYQYVTNEMQKHMVQQAELTNSYYRTVKY